MSRRLVALVARLGTRKGRAVVLALATLLAATSVGPHRALDDYVLALIARGKGAPLGLHRGTLDLFTFTTGDPANNRELMETGLMLPWWTDPELRISFFRPLASFTHFLDERLFPSSPVLMHLHSLAWFAFLLGAVAVVYERLESTPLLAGFSLALYALDDAHGTALAWLANRNALIATGFACLALAAHDSARRDGKRAHAVLAPLFLLLGLLAGEAGIGVLAYLGAYALHRERGSLAARALSIAPYLAVVVLWRLMWTRYGFGAHGSGAYIDPLGDPRAFLAVLPEKLVLLFQGQFVGIPSDQGFLGPPAQRPILVLMGVVSVLVVTFALAPTLRKDATSRFWATGMGLSLVPLAATFPSDRMLLFTGLGAMPLLARLFLTFLGGKEQPSGLDRARARVTVGLFLANCVVGPVLLPLRAAQMELFARVHDRAAAGIPSDPGVRERTVVVVAAPTVILANYIQAERAVAGVPRPKHLYILASASSGLAVTRTAGQGLTVKPDAGFLYTPLERHYRGSKGFARGEAVVLDGMRATVTDVRDGGEPVAVEFSFDALDHVDFVTWRGGRFEPFSLPELGATVRLPEEDLSKILVQASVGELR